MNPLKTKILWAGATFCLVLTFWSFPRTWGQEAQPKESAVTNSSHPQSAAPQTIVVVQGAGGSKEYQQIFTEACRKIQKAAEKSNAQFFWIGQAKPKSDSSSQENDKQSLKSTLASQSQGSSQLWLILMGHGTYDRRSAKFNLQGPDVSAAELKEWLQPLQRPVAIINCASASSPFINRLTGKGRVVVTATKSGFELNYARFGVYFAEALTDLSADIDKDEQVSLLESFLFASRKVDEFYKSESRLATEHALIDDNGDGKGTPLGFFRGIRVVKSSEEDILPDGPIANQIHLIQSEFEKLISLENRRLRNELESQLEKLRLRKSSMKEDEYFKELERIALDLAALYEQIENSQSKAKQPKSPEPKKSKAKGSQAEASNKTEEPDKPSSKIESAKSKKKNSTKAEDPKKQATNSQ